MTKEELLDKVIINRETGFMTNDSQLLDWLEEFELNALVIRQDHFLSHVCSDKCFNCSYNYFPADKEAK